MNEKNFGFNIESNNQGGVAYNASMHHGKRIDLFVDIEKADENKKTVLKNMLGGTVAFKGINSLISSAEEDTLEEIDLQNSLDTLTKGVKIARSEYIHPLVNGVGGRVRHMLSEKSSLTGYDAFIEADKIAKDLTFYEQNSPNDILLKSEENKNAIHKITSEFQSLIGLYMDSNKGTEESTDTEIEVRQKSGKLNDENFKNQVLAVCAEANDILMDLESSTVSKNFSEINILVSDLKQTSDKEEIVTKLKTLKSLVENELGK